MKSIEIVITNPTGLHTRPGASFVKEAKRFQSEILVKKGDKIANGKSLMKLLQVGISYQDKISISAEGPDEEAALSALSTFISSLED
ncbi:HPr family phosphocarrier protein [Pantoea sp. NPDC088449]|uniref:Phosphocarrier protein HPr n=1 Tax=Candidatus Pantoea floridensis TaxID=1938870 RepID=A0A286DNU9_9GAMM|nr:HPr family phosphocarrier protein [Pantoea floridensis]PIF15163.1 phosphocarrier protein HPr [Enterobacteriaceae bacterium JKS000233]SOD60214.1 phosphocarrier protein HPr [Pantoea floridensis]